MNQKLEKISYTAASQVGGARIVHILFRENLKKELAVLLNQYQSFLGIDFHQIFCFINEIDCLRRFNPSFYSQYWDLYDSLNDENADRCKLALTRLIQCTSGDVYENGFSVRSFDESNLCDRVLREYVVGPDGIKSPTGESAVVAPAIYGQVEKHLPTIESVFAVLKDVDAGMLDEIREYVRTLVLFSGKTATGITSVRSFGNVYLRQPRFDMSDMGCLIYFIEHIVHETSHLHLNALMLHDRMITNESQEVFQAPLREDKRPMYGIFHATFVLSRLVRVFERWANTSDSLQVKEKYGDLISQHRLGLETVSQHAKLTESGEEMLNSMMSFARS